MYRAAASRSLFVLTLALARPCLAQIDHGPQPAPAATSIPVPRDIPFAGAIELRVDATDTSHKIFKVHETIPVQKPGEMILLYPEWETGSHAPTASVAKLAGLVIQANSKRIAWQRDPVDTHAFRVSVPAGARRIDLDFLYLSPVSARSGAMVMTQDMENVQWQSMLLYPAGWFARNLQVAATLRVPPDFTVFTSLTTEHEDGRTLTFRPTSLETLVDSPVYAGRHTRRILLSNTSDAQIALDLVADGPAGLEVPAVEIDKLRSVIHQTRRVFSSRHYDRYDFIVSLSDVMPSGGGVEHLESSENNVPMNFFNDAAHQLPSADLLVHEYVHSWNGRFRQPADLWTPNFNVPMRDTLLWVYEGLTEFWGRVLGARAGFRSKQETLDALALDAATVIARAGRSWKSLQDSNHDPLYMAGHPIDWRDWQRREDYYVEGVMLWLDVDTLIRQKTDGKRSLDDFARAFFGVNDGSRATMTYTFADVCATLNRIAPHDWTVYLRRRLDSHEEQGLLDGLTRAGYRLIFTDTPTEAFRQAETDAGVSDLSASIGLTVTSAGLVRAVSWNGPAFAAGFAPGARITLVNGKPFDRDGLKAAVQASTTAPLDVTYEVDGHTQSARINYHGTLRYPRLERIDGAPDLLTRILEPVR